MSLSVKINSSAVGSIELSDDTVDRIVFDTDTPNDSRDRSKDLAIGCTIYGKIRRGKVGADDTLNLPKWAMVSSSDNCYADVTITVKAPLGRTIRETMLPNAFVTTYKEKFVDASGTGSFELKIKQLVDDNKNVKVQGGY